MAHISGQVEIKKDASGLIGVTIGGGVPHCPCIYIIQIYDNSPADKDGTLEPGDEIIAINGVSVRNLTRTQTAQAIQRSEKQVAIHYNKFHIDSEFEGEPFDILVKKFKHRLTENISPSTADALGLSRAILCNDNLVNRIEELEKTAALYSEIKYKVKRKFKAFYELNKVHKEFGDVLTEIGCKEKQAEAGEALVKFGESHRLFEKQALETVKLVKHVINGLDTYINKAIPDTKLTIDKYQSVKFEYLSYCLKIKEMDDEETESYHMDEPLERIETGNHEYRVTLKRRASSRKKFTKIRIDVLEKLELLDQKHVQHLATNLLKMVSALNIYNTNCYDLFKEAPKFPLNIDPEFDENFFDD